eukprot:2739557-Amphidinium_carterae.1
MECTRGGRGVETLASTWPCTNPESTKAEIDTMHALWGILHGWFNRCARALKALSSSEALMRTLGGYILYRPVKLVDCVPESEEYGVAEAAAYRRDKPVLDQLQCIALMASSSSQSPRPVAGWVGEERVD